jgi:hypothetical protein
MTISQRSFTVSLTSLALRLAAQAGQRLPLRLTGTVRNLAVRLDSKRIATRSTGPHARRIAVPAERFRRGAHHLRRSWRDERGKKHVRVHMLVAPRRSKARFGVHARPADRRVEGFVRKQAAAGYEIVYAAPGPCAARMTRLIEGRRRPATLARVPAGPHERVSPSGYRQRRRSGRATLASGELRARDGLIVRGRSETGVDGVRGRGGVDDRRADGVGERDLQGAGDLGGLLLALKGEGDV